MVAMRDIAESRPVAALAEAFEAAGHEFALVGGPVRDALLGRQVNDLDFTTSARPDETRAILETLTKNIWDVGRDFGTIAAKVHGEQVEVTSYRADSYSGDSRKPEVEPGTWLLWFGPLLLVLVGSLVVWRILRRGADRDPISPDDKPEW